VALADKLVLVAILLSTIAVIWALRRSGGRGGQLLAASIVAFNGVALIAMMVGHSLDIASQLYVGRSCEGVEFTYNFRTYSLFLLAAVLTACGTALVQAAFGLTRNTAGATRHGLRSAALTLLVVIPLLPIQLFFASILAVLALVSTVVLALQRVPAEIRE
jgi:hypothetical protein